MHLSEAGTKRLEERKEKGQTRVGNNPTTTKTEEHY